MLPHYQHSNFYILSLKTVIAFAMQCLCNMNSKTKKNKVNILQSIKYTVQIQNLLKSKNHDIYAYNILFTKQTKINTIEQNKQQQQNTHQLFYLLISIQQHLCFTQHYILIIIQDLLIMANNRLKISQILFYEPGENSRNTNVKINSQFNLENIPGLVLKPLAKKQKIKKQLEPFGCSYMIIQAQISSKKVQFEVLIWDLPKKLTSMQNFYKQVQNCNSKFYEARGMDKKLAISAIIIINPCETDIHSQFTKAITQIHLQLSSIKSYHNGWFVSSPSKNPKQARRQGVYNNFLDYSKENKLLFFELESNRGFKKVLQNIYTWICMKRGEKNYKDEIKAMLGQIKEYKIMIDRKEQDKKLIAYKNLEYWKKMHNQSWAIILQLKVHINKMVNFLQNSKIDENQMKQWYELHEKIEEIQQIAKDLGNQQDLQTVETFQISNEEEDQTIGLKKLLQRLNKKKKQIDQQQDEEYTKFQKLLETFIQLREIYVKKVATMKAIKDEANKQSEQLQVQSIQNDLFGARQRQIQKNLKAIILLQTQEAEDLLVQIQTIFIHTNEWFQLVQGYVEGKKDKHKKERKDVWTILLNTFICSKAQQFNIKQQQPQTQYFNQNKEKDNKFLRGTSIIEQQFFSKEELQFKRDKKNMSLREAIDLMKDFLQQLDKKIMILQQKKRKDYFHTEEYLHYKLDLLQHNLSTFLIHEAEAHEVISNQNSSSHTPS